MGHVFLDYGLNFGMNDYEEIQDLVTYALQYFSENNKESK